VSQPCDGDAPQSQESDTGLDAALQKMRKRAGELGLELAVARMEIAGLKPLADRAEALERENAALRRVAEVARDMVPVAVDTPLMDGCYCGSCRVNRLRAALAALEAKP
jgi:hypothetical protein